MASIKAVLFDFGGTLFDYAVLESAERQCIDELIHFMGVEVESKNVHKAYRNALYRVFMEYLPRPFYLHRDLFKDALFEMLNDVGGTPEAETYDWYRERQWTLHRRDFRLRKDVENTLASLRDQNLHLGIVSNIDEDQLDHLMGISNIRHYFDSIVSSEKTRSCKPDPEIFRHALENAKCRPEEVLFVGDTPFQDIVGANRMGMNSVLILSREDQKPKPHEEEFLPDYVIREIPELLDLL
jgi:2-haloalkanoic acid dehalogenase type II